MEPRTLLGPMSKMRIKLTLVIVVLTIAIPVTTWAQSLPERLEDEAFWKMIEDFSEPGGTFSSENLLSNELYFQHVIPALQATIKPGGVYLGVGPEQNFTYIAALRPKIAFIIDIRRQNMLEILMYKALFELSDNRADFVSKLVPIQERIAAFRQDRIANRGDVTGCTYTR